MRVIFSKLAKQELDDATRYYEVELQSLESCSVRS